MNQKKLVENIIKATNVIEEQRPPKANYIHLSEEYIQKLADDNLVTFNEMVETIKNTLK